MTATALNDVTRFLLRRVEQKLRARTVESMDPIARYCPHKPRPKQQAFIDLDCEEAFYGGALGGGKSDALLMAALKYVHIPGYSALILRRDYPRLSLPGAIMDRAYSWLINTDAKWNGDRRLFRFPSGATLQFGFIDNPMDRHRYASSEFQFIGWDELTEIDLAMGTVDEEGEEQEDENNPYLFMFTRLRPSGHLACPVPLRVRSASNPGNVGHAFVKKRFIPQGFAGVLAGEVQVLEVEGRKFIPACTADNPTVDPEAYHKRLSKLPPVTRERLLRGDWDVAEGLQIPLEWFRYYTMQGEMLIPIGSDGQRLEPLHQAQCRRIATIDTAGTSRDKADEARGKPPSWSVCGIWDIDRSRKSIDPKTGKLTAQPILLLRHVWRDRVGWNELKVRVPELLHEWGVKSTRIENAHVGPPLRDEIKGFPDVQLVGPMLPGMADGYRGAKLERAIASGYLSMLEAGRVFLPQADSPWKSAFLNEHTSWDGSPEATCDQIDQSGYAAWECKKGGNSWGGPIYLR